VEYVSGNVPPGDAGHVPDVVVVPDEVAVDALPVDDWLAAVEQAATGRSSATMAICATRRSPGAEMRDMFSLMF